jgi:hypothetical protein
MPLALLYIAAACLIVVAVLGMRRKPLSGPITKPCIIIRKRKGKVPPGHAHVECWDSAARKWSPLIAALSRVNGLGFEPYRCRAEALMALEPVFNRSPTSLFDYEVLELHHEQSVPQLGRNPSVLDGSWT